VDGSIAAATKNLNTTTKKRKIGSKAEVLQNATSGLKASQRQALDAREEERLLSRCTFLKKRNANEVTDPAFFRLNRKLVLREVRQPTNLF